MNKIFILSFLILCTSCSDDSFDSQKNDSNNQKSLSLEQEMESLTFTYNDVKKACEEGCEYDYQLYTVANSLQNQAVSLNKAQLESIRNTCNVFCSKKVFSEIKKSRESESLSIGAPIEQHQEQKTKKVDSGLIPFEDL